MSDIVSNQVMLREDGFSIRAGIFSYFIKHDACDTVVYDIFIDRTPAKQGPCEECDKMYPKKMEGLITLLDWKDEGVRREPLE